MKFFSNAIFLSRLTRNNVSQYFKKSSTVKSDILKNNSVNWYGHATALINLSGKIIITDPVLTKMLGYFKRVADKPYEIKNNIHIDYIVLSHGHMDHMSFTSLSSLNKDAVVIAPKGYKSLISALGFKKVIVLHPGEIYHDKYIKIRAYAANHDGRRLYLGIDNESLSFLIERKGKSVFFAGDTAFTEKFKNIKSDIALMPVGCYKPDRFSEMHCTPRQSYAMFKMMRSKTMIPIHYKTFMISLEDFDETEKTLKNIKDESIKFLEIGETFCF